MGKESENLRWKTGARQRMEMGENMKAFKFVQYEDDGRGNSLNFGIDNLNNFMHEMNGHGEKNVIKAAFIRHDEDLYTPDDYCRYQDKHGKNPEWKVGQTKRPHWHGILLVRDDITAKQIADALGIKLYKLVQRMWKQPNETELQAFHDYEPYLIHATNADRYNNYKHKYSPYDVISNYDYVSEMVLAGYADYYDIANATQEEQDAKYYIDVEGITR